MASDVRLRGEVGERRTAPQRCWYDNIERRNVWEFIGPRHDRDCFVHLDRRVADRRQSPSIAARVDECIAAAREPLLRLIEEQAKEIERLTLQLNEHMDEVVHLTGTLAHRDKEIANLCHVMTYDPTKLAAGAWAGEVAGE